MWILAIEQNYPLIDRKPVRRNFFFELDGIGGFARADKTVNQMCDHHFISSFFNSHSILKLWISKAMLLDFLRRTATTQTLSTIGASQLPSSKDPIGLANSSFKVLGKGRRGSRGFHIRFRSQIERATAWLGLTKGLDEP
jgi:hypothetical protein